MRHSPESLSFRGDPEGEFRTEFAAFAALTNEIQLALSLKLPFPPETGEEPLEPAFREVVRPELLSQRVREFVPIGDHRSAPEYVCLSVEIKGFGRDPFGKKITVLRLLPELCTKEQRTYEELQVRPRCFMRLALLRGSAVKAEVDRKAMERRYLAQIDFMHRPPRYVERQRVLRAGHEFLAYLALGKQYHRDRDALGELKFEDLGGYRQQDSEKDADTWELPDGVEPGQMPELDSLPETG